MTTDSVPVDRIASPLEQADALLWARVALMSELEASLHGSRKALLALDLPGIEHGTNEQAGLIREFEALQRDTLMPALERQPGEEAKAGLIAGSPELEEKLRRSVCRILEAARLQTALLARAQCKLRVLANMLAGPSIIYGPLLAPNDALRVSGGKQRSGEI